MENLFALLTLASFVLLLIGFFSPKMSLFWDKKNQPTKKRSGIIYGIALVISFITFGVITDGSKSNKALSDSTKNQVKVTEKNTLEKKENTEIKSTELVENKTEIFNLERIYYDADGNKKMPDENDITFKVLEVLKHEKNEAREAKNNFENLYVLVSVSSYNKDDIERIAFKIKDEYADFAPNNCNVDLWDDKKAYEKYLEQQRFYTESFDKLMIEFQKTRVPIGDKHQQIKEKWDRKNYPFIADHNIGSIMLGNNFSYYQLQDDYYKKMGGKNYKK